MQFKSKCKKNKIAHNMMASSAQRFSCRWSAQYV